MIGNEFSHSMDGIHIEGPSQGTIVKDNHFTAIIAGGIYVMGFGYTAADNTFENIGAKDIVGINMTALPRVVVLTLVLLIGLTVFCWHRRRRKRREAEVTGGQIQKQ
jgi:hypothetical protein